MAQFPNLELVSPQSNKSDTTTERRRMPRLCLTGELFRVAPSGKVFSIVDLSPSGMGIRIIDNEDLRLFPVGALVKGVMNLKRNKYEIEARARNIRGDSVGFEFENLAIEVAEALKKHLDPSSLGAELRPIPASEQSTLWYHGPSGTDLLLWRGIDGQYRRMALYVQGSYIQWDTEKGIKTGLFDSSQERSEIRGILRFETCLLSEDTTPDVKKLSIAKTVLLSSNITQDLQKWCIRQLSFPN